MLVIACKKEDAVRTDRPADGPAELMLAAFGLEVEKGRLRSEEAVAQKVEGCSVQMIRSGLGYDIDHGAPGASKLRAVGV